MILLTCIFLYIIAAAECPPVNLSGIITELRGIQEGITMMFSCDETYMLSGSPISQCLPDGSWSGDIPECIGKQSLLSHIQIFQGL